MPSPSHPIIGDLHTVFLTAKTRKKTEIRSVVWSPESWTRFLQPQTGR